MSQVASTPLTIGSPIARLARPADARRLERLGIRTVRDLLLYLPHDWERYGEPAPIAWLRPGQQAAALGKVEAVAAKRAKYKRTQLTEALLRDGTGTLRLTFFNQPWMAAKLRAASRVAVAGQVRPGWGGLLEMQNPHWEPVSGDGPHQVGGLMPKYHLTKGLTSRRIAELVEAVLPLADQLEEVVPQDVRARHHLMPIAQAVRAGHTPAEESEWQEAKRRMAFAELFELQASFLWLKRAQRQERATPVPYRQGVIERFKAGLGFELTRAQRRAIWDVYRDMEKDVPMNRLINGDVGSGKTAVAAAAAAMVHAAGLQTVVMAPTEILARQHLEKFRAYLEASFPGLVVELLVSGQSAAERRRVLTSAASGHCGLLVGTHALIEDRVELANLGLAIVDEQHRFGTRQREQLRVKAGAGRPHFLAMTATPIPRSLALALYGEMSLSVIDEMPPGRTPVETRVVTPSERDEAYDLVRREVRAGRQAFVICPLIEESEKAAEVRAATAEFERLHREVFPDLRLALVHGRHKEKDAVMRAFRDGATDVLVATPVIEVGVDVPNATVMMIEGSDRFGLAQLHQFRGRVGRGSLRSYCLLLVDDTSEASLRRLRLLTQLDDGFRLAEEDMRLRGAGQLMGPRQHGLTDSAMEALAQPQLLSDVRQEADRVLEADPELSRHPALRAAVAARLAAVSIS